MSRILRAVGRAQVPPHEPAADVRELLAIVDQGLRTRSLREAQDVLLDVRNVLTGGGNRG